MKPDLTSYLTTERSFYLSTLNDCSVQVADLGLGIVSGKYCEFDAY